MLLSRSSLPPEREDTFTSVTIAVCIIGQIAMQNQSFDYIQAALKSLVAITIASSTGLMVITDYQLAH